MRHRSARIQLEGDAGGKPFGAEAFQHAAIIAVARVREAMEETVIALEHGPRSDEPRLRHPRGAIAGLRSPARVHALRPRAFGEILDDAGRHAGGDPHLSL